MRRVAAFRPEATLMPLTGNTERERVRVSVSVLLVNAARYILQATLAEGQPDHRMVPWRWVNPHCPVGSPGTVPACTLGPGSRKSQLSGRNIDPMGRFFCFGPRDPHSCTFFHCQGRRRPERTERRRRGGALNSRGHFGLDRPQRTRR